MVQTYEEKDYYRRCPDFIHHQWIQWASVINGMDAVNRSVLIVFNVILIFSTVFLNLLSVVTIRKSSQLKRKQCYFVILIQSAVDFGVGIVSIPFFVVFLALPLFDIDNCLAFVVLAVSSFPLPAFSLITLFAMTIERYIGVLHPYSYQPLVTKERMLLFVGAWGFIYLTIIVSSIRFPSVMFYSSSLILPAYFVFITYAYTKIYVVVRKLVHSERRPVDVVHEQTGKKRILREIKHVKSCFAVVLCFAMCMLPLAIEPVIFHFALKHYASYLRWTVTLPFLNSNLNSVIFFWNKRLLRTEAIKILNGNTVIGSS